MTTLKYYTATQGLPNMGQQMSPYLGLKLGLCDTVCIPAEEYENEIDSLNRRPHPIYHDLIKSLNNRRLTSIFNALPNNLMDDVLSVRSEEEFTIFLLNLINLLKDMTLLPANRIRASLNILNGQDKSEAIEFYTRFESHESIDSFYQYTCVGCSPYNTLSLENVFKSMDSIYEKQCQTILQTGPTYNVPPMSITSFKALIKKIDIDPETGQLTIDNENSFTLVPKNVFS